MDEAPVMAGECKERASKACTKVRESGGEAVKMQCIIHQEALCAKTVHFGNVMNTVMKTVNIIGRRGLFHREFQAFPSVVGSEYSDLIYHSDLRWLILGSVLQRFYSLRSNIDKLFERKGQTSRLVTLFDWQTLLFELT